MVGVCGAGEGHHLFNRVIFILIFFFLSPRSRKDDDFTIELAIFLSDLSAISS